jgi:hypothetical protein
MHRRLCLILIGAVASASSALAQAPVDSRCVKMKDPTGCTCALATGGSISGTSWSRGRSDDRVAFDTCVAERGGQTRVRPQTIPGGRL